ECEGYTVPSREKLREIFAPSAAESPYTSPLETSSWGPNRALSRYEQTTVDPLKSPLEVLEYWTKEWVFTVLQRKVVIRKEKNEFGCLPFVSSAFTDVLDAAFGIGISRLIGGEQKTQQGVLNSFLDGLSLDLM